MILRATKFENGQQRLKEIIDQGLITAKAVYGFWPAHSEGDDVVLWTDATRSQERARFPMLRQQSVLNRSAPNRCLADFVAPKDSGRPDHVGAFAITAGLGADDLARSHEEALNDYDAILIKALADRLAEAGAEWLHARARKDWGYGETEVFSNEELIAESYRGIRPAFGYAACPDHRAKRTLFELLQASEAGMELTETCAVSPAASVSGLYFAHPESHYFSVGPLGQDQIEDYSRRTGSERKESERWLVSNLGYVPSEND